MTRFARRPFSARQIALQAVIGEPGVGGVMVVVLATGLGLLLDFQITHWHPVFSIGLVLVSVPLSLYWTLRKTQTRIMYMDRQPNNAEYMRNLALATVAGQAGCGTLVLVFGALFGGMFLDSRLDTHPVFTIGLVLVAIPVSLYAMIHLVLTSVAALQPPPATGTRATSSDPAEDNHSLKKE